MECYSISDLSWTANMLYLPTSTRPMPLHRLVYDVFVDDNHKKRLTLHHEMSKEVLFECIILDIEERLFSALQTAILKSKLRA